MKIKSLQISNILSFKHHQNVADAEKVVFDDGLNIIIGENGAGKSTALEVVNFLFKRVLYRQYNFNQEIYNRRSSTTLEERKQIIQVSSQNNFSGFRMEPNWNSEDKPQIIRVEIRLDDIDLQNITLLTSNLTKLQGTIGGYTNRGVAGHTTHGDIYLLDIHLDKNNWNFTVHFQQGAQDFGYQYLTDYNFYKEAIALHNLEHPTDPIDPLHESFTLISSYRNYHAFNPSISLRDQSPAQQMQHIKNLDFSKSLNTSDHNEPTIFGLVRLKVAETHFGLISKKLDEKECEEKANKLPFILLINQRLKVVNLECKIKLIDLRTWQYSFEFFDMRRNKSISDINSLSAGQKAIIHLVFEAYGRGNLKGGLVIIDEPEIHLHYQFQSEYLQVINELNKEQNCQYILVTHSEALINSSTINHVRRFSLSHDGYTQIKAPTLNTGQKMLIKILDNTRSTYAFFSKKVLLVEGDSDRYFFKSIIQEKYPQLDQEIAVLDIGGKGNYVEWNNLFESFGLTVYFIADLDFATERFYPKEKGVKLKTSVDIKAYKKRNPDWQTRINNEYHKRIYILRNGDLEHYLGIKKDLTEVINFCNKELTNYLADNRKQENKEVKEIIRQVTL